MRKWPSLIVFEGLEAGFLCSKNLNTMDQTKVVKFQAKIVVSLISDGKKLENNFVAEI